MNVSMPTLTSTPPHDPAVAALLARPELRRHLERYLRRRLPQSEVDDTVQSVLCAALASRRAPTDPEELRKWITGIARHTIAAHWKRAARETIDESPDAPTAPAPIEAASLARWAETQASLSPSDHADETLDWMAREADGEPLERIASDANVPAARVRQRVSRMRRWMRERWAAELAAVAVITLLALAIAAWWMLGGKRVEMAKDTIAPDAIHRMGASAPAPAPAPTPTPAPAPTPTPTPTPTPAPAPTTTHATPSSTTAAPYFGTGTGTGTTPSH
jgi:DNA-directed RNA polymerase specialized sigma24 family protein